jgi:ferredoxin
VDQRWTVDDLKTWTNSLLRERRVVAPVVTPAGPVWAPIRDAGEVAWDYGRTKVSPREWLLPRHETLFFYDLATNPPQIVEAPLDAPPTVLLLVHPCDVAGVRALDAVMRWDYIDEPFEARRAGTLLVALGCAAAPSPESCFCAAAGVDPAWSPQADVMISPVEGGYTVCALTEAGAAALAGAPQPLSAAPADPGRPAPGKADTLPLDVAAAAAALRDRFDDPVWESRSDACVGCVTCAYVCPSCHCFDVVDEGDWRRGERVRNWDACAFDHFTAHASGHNPRPRQSRRYRQRIYHKFVYYPDKFGHLLCTGCGRCVDACPAGMDLVEVLQVFGAAPAGQGGVR